MAHRRRSCSRTAANLESRRAISTRSRRRHSRTSSRACGVGRLIVVGAQTDACIRSTLHGAIVRGYDATLVSDAHTTEDMTRWGSPPPDQVIELHELLLEEPFGAGPTGRNRGDKGRRFRSGPMMAQPGSPSRSTMASIAASSASLNSHPDAAAFASTCSTLVTPVRTEAMPGWKATQEMASSSSV